MQYDNLEVALAKLAGQRAQPDGRTPHPQSYKAHLARAAAQKPSFSEWLALKVEAVVRTVGHCFRALRSLAWVMIAAPRRAVTGALVWWSGAMPWR